MISRCMIDIETLSTDPDAVILSIALVGQTLEGWHCHCWPLDWGAQLRAGRTVSPETLLFWARQGAGQFQAQLEWTPSQIHLGDALVALLPILAEFDELWARGSMDFTVLRHAYGRREFEPWDHRLERDLRTLEAILPMLTIERRADEPVHTANGDAAYQWRCLQAYLARAGGM